MFIRNLPPVGRRIGILPVEAPEPFSAGLLGAVPAAAAGERLGDLSMKYETSARPGQEARAAARVSTNRKDKGGVSYGPYQLASNYDQPQAFMRREGAPWAHRFNGMDATEFGGPYGKMWQTAAAEDPKAFFEAQHAYIKRTHYDPVVAAVRKRTGVDIDRLPQAIRDAAWSAAVQHEGASKIITDGINNAKILARPGTPDFNTAALDLIYDRRTGYVKTLKEEPADLPNLLNRYRLERKDARAMLNRR